MNSSSSKELRPFHLAFPIYNIKETKDWYLKYLECEIGRESSEWIDFNFFGHQISGHLINKKQNDILKNNVDGKQVPVRHFGIILNWKNWEKLAQKLNKLKIKFIIKPHIRFKGEIGEQGTMFIEDPSNNILEFKSFKTDELIFKK